MVRRLFLAAAACLLIALAGAHPARAQSPADEIFRLVNEFRAGYGLPPFTYNAQLAQAAQVHANYIATNNFYSHYWPDGTGPQQRAETAGYGGWAGENYVAGTKLTPQQGVTWWSNSPVHFANMVSQRHVEAGVGFAVGNDQNWYVLVIGEPTAGGAPSRPAPRQADTVAFVAPIELSSPREDGSIVHTVLQGHTVWAIAARYGVSVADIYLFNGLNEDSVINPGDELTIRLAEGQAPPPTPTPPAFHVVQEGENLWAIAAWHQIDLATLLYLNNMTEDTVVHAGNEVKIRLLPGEAPPPTPTPQLTHIIETGDTAWAIALRYGLTLDQLVAYNSGMDPNGLLQIGQELAIRPPTETPTPLPTPTASATPPAPVVVALDTATPQPTRVEAAALAKVDATPVPEGDGVGWNAALGLGAMVAGLALTVLAAVAILFLFRRDG
jgi:LysM repeat protein